jgi:tryptophan synthase alpha chain
MNQLDTLFAHKKDNILAIYFTPGYPEIDDTQTIILALQRAGVDLIEVGIPFSDPMADGPVIQHSNDVALKNGMNIQLIFNNLLAIKEQIKTPLVMMGYFNTIHKFGVEHYLEQCNICGVSGSIIPDLPIDEYRDKYMHLFKKAHHHAIFLVSPQTSTERLKEIAALQTAFVYVVSTTTITGGALALDENRAFYMNVADIFKQTPRLMGFGIHNSESFQQACQYANGGIIGSAFIKHIAASTDIQTDTFNFIHSIRL